MGKAGSNDSPRVNERIFELTNSTTGVVIARQVRLAATSAGRRKGLLGISEMDSESGLWICPCEAVHTFGMKMAIDVLFLDRRHRVCKISQDMRNNRIAVCLSAHSVVELSAGRLAALEVEIGHTLEFRPQTE